MTNTESNEVIEFLIKEYVALKSEIISLGDNYKAHVRYFQIIATAVIALYAAIVYGQNSNISIAPGVLIFVMYSITTAVGYTAFTVLETLHLINALGAYLSVQEDKINSLAGRNLLCWETSFAVSLYNLPTITTKTYYPGGYLFVFQTVLMSLIVMATPLYFYFNALSPPMWQIALLYLNIIYSTGTLIAIFLVGDDVLTKSRFWLRIRTFACQIALHDFGDATEKLRNQIDRTNELLPFNKKGKVG